MFVSSPLMNEMAMTAQHLIVIGKGRLLAGTGMAEFVPGCLAAMVDRSKWPISLRQ